MRVNRKAMLAAALMAGAAVMTGCTANTVPEATSAPNTAQQQTAQPETVQTPEKMEDEAAQAFSALYVNGVKVNEEAAKENGKLLLPLTTVGEALGWKASSTKSEEETQTSCEIRLEKDQSRITVSYVVSDNTIRRISWQKDGLLIPVDTSIETFSGTVYVPAAFFEEAMGVKIAEGENKVEVSSPEPMDTPQTNQ